MDLISILAIIGLISYIIYTLGSKITEWWRSWRG